MKQIQPVLVTNEKGIYCPKGDFYIDPWKPVKNAIVTHAHADHLRFGNKNYIVTNKSLRVTKHRLSKDETKSEIIGYEYDENFDFNGVTVSFHPAGHILGSAQVRVEIGNQVAVASGDYKRSQDPTCQPFELQKCDQFISEATFGLPIYRWRDGSHIGQQMIDWWRRNASENRPSVLYCYSLGKAQRLLAEFSKIIKKQDRPIYIHGALKALIDIYQEEGVKLYETKLVSRTIKRNYEADLILAPPSAFRSPWMKRFKNSETAFASGWMRVRGRRRMAGYDKGFVLSDHADWPNLIKTIRETGANDVTLFATRSNALARYLGENYGITTNTLSTTFDSDDD